MTDDPFPRARFEALVGRLPAYLKLAWRLGRDPLLSRTRRVALVAAAGYLVSPIDAVPGAIPVLGQLDDLAVAIGAIKLALGGLSPQRRREHLMAVGLVEADVMSDLRGIASITGWILRKGGRLTAQGARLGARAAVAGGRAAVAGAGKVADGAKSTAAAAGRIRGAVAARIADRRAPKSGPKADALEIDTPPDQVP